MKISRTCTHNLKPVELHHSALDKTMRIALHNVPIPHQVPSIFGISLCSLAEPCKTRTYMHVRCNECVHLEPLVFCPHASASHPVSPRGVPSSNAGSTLLR